MHLSFARYERDGTVTAMPTELAVLLVGVSARQAASPTARAQSRLALTTSAGGLLAPQGGAFHRAAAQAITRWKDE